MGAGRWSSQPNNQNVLTTGKQQKQLMGLWADSQPCVIFREVWAVRRQLLDFSDEETPDISKRVLRPLDFRFRDETADCVIQ